MTRARKLLALDSGIDVTGWALFAIPDCRPWTVDDYRKAFLAKGSLRTKPSETLPQRLMGLHVQLRRLVSEQPMIDVLLVEIPKFDGQNREKLSRARTRDGFAKADVATMNRAIGALLLSGVLCGIPEVIPKRASGVEKKVKSAWALNIWPEFGDGNSNADERDALHLGALSLAEYVAPRLAHHERM